MSKSHALNVQPLIPARPHRTDAASCLHPSASGNLADDKARKTWAQIQRAGFNQPPITLHNSGAAPERIYFAAPMTLYGTPEYAYAIAEIAARWPGADIVGSAGLYSSTSHWLNTFEDHAARCDAVAILLKQDTTIAQGACIEGVYMSHKKLAFMIALRCFKIPKSYVEVFVTGRIVGMRHPNYWTAAKFDPPPRIKMPVKAASARLTNGKRR